MINYFTIKGFVPIYRIYPFQHVFINRELALVHYVVLIGNHAILRIVDSTVNYTMAPIIVIVYDVSIVIVYDISLLSSMTYRCQSIRKKTDCTNLWVIKPKNQVSPSSGFLVPDWWDTVLWKSYLMLICWVFRDRQRFVWVWYRNHYSHLANSGNHSFQTPWKCNRKSKYVHLKQFNDALNDRTDIQYLTKSLKIAVIINIKILPKN